MSSQYILAAGFVCGPLRVHGEGTGRDPGQERQEGREKSRFLRSVLLRQVSRVLHTDRKRQTDNRSIEMDR